MKAWIAALLLAACLTTSACDDRECIKSHTEPAAPIYVKSGNVYIPIPQTRTVCDEYADEK